MDKDRQEFERKYGSLPKDQPSFIKKKDPILDKVNMIVGNYRGILNYENLVIEQNLLTHSTFSFIWRIGGVTPKFRDRGDLVSQHQGSKVVIIFKNSITDETVNFKGIIDEIEIIDKSNANSGYLVSGFSADVLINDIPQCQTYFNKSIEEITKIIDQRTNKAFFTGFHNDNKYKKQIPYIVQYNETDFEFLQRLCTQYGEWMYYDGDYLQIGNFKNAKAVLHNGVNLYDFHVKTKIRSHKIAYKGYDPLSANPLKCQALDPQLNSQSSFTAQTLRASKNNYNRKNPNFAYTSSAKNSEDMERIQNLFQQAKEAQATIYTGEAQIPLQIGGNVTIIKDNVEFKSIITQIRHWSKGDGHYQNTFEAIPADVKAPPYADPLFHPKAEMQEATVIENNDPEDLGRIKVAFDWGHDSDWMRVRNDYSGSSKGDHKLPEIGEKVLLDFLGDNPENAIVIGTLRNGKEKSPYTTEGNDLKARKSRSGVEELINDAEKSWKQSTPDGNFLHFDGQGNATLNVPKDLLIAVGGNLTITVGENMTVTVSQNKTETITMNNTESVGMVKSTTVLGDASLSIRGKLDEIIDGDVHSEVTKGKTIVNSENGIETSSDGMIKRNSQGEMQHNSAEKTKFH